MGRHWIAESAIIARCALFRISTAHGQPKMSGKAFIFYSSLPVHLKTVLSSHVACAVIAALLSLICYWNSLQGELVHDDIFAIRDNPDIRPSAPLSQLLRNDFWGKPMSSALSHKSYRPLTVLTFRSNYFLHELVPLGYHVVNVALHTAAVLLFYWFCKVAVFRYNDLAFLCTVLFAVHPVHTEAVAGIVGRADVLASIFFLLAFMTYKSCCEGKRTMLLFLSVACGSMAMFFKEHGITAFGVCLVYDVLIVSRPAVKKLLTEGKPLLLRVAVLVVTTIFLLVFRIWMLHGELPHFSSQDNPASFSEDLQTRLLTYSHLFYFNAKLLVFPLTLCYDWQMGSIPLVESLIEMRNVGTGLFFLYLTALGCFALLGKSSQRQRVALIGLLLLVVPFLPASNIFLRVGFVVAERILYLPSMGYCILLVLGVQTLSRARTTARGRVAASYVSPFYLGLLLVGFFTARTIVRNPVWHTRESLFRSGLETVPNNAKIHYNYANFLRDCGRASEAIEHYKSAISLAPDHAVSHNNLGTMLELEEAEYHFREAVKHNPQHYRAYFNLGRNMEQRGKSSEAEDAFRESININPEYHDSLMGLATLLADGGRVEEGWPYMEKAAAAAPDNADVFNNMGAYLLRMGKQHEAIQTYEKVLELDPHHSTAMTNLARTYRLLGNNEKAEEFLKKSLSLRKDPTTLQLLGALYYNTGRYREAGGIFKEVLQLEPDRVETVCSYGNALAQIGDGNVTIRVLNRATQVHPDAGCIHFGLASVFAQQTAHEKALVHSSRAVELVDSSSAAEAYHMHAGILKDLGRLGEAEKFCKILPQLDNYRRAVSLAPNKPTFRMNLGAVLHMKKEYRSAREQYEAALRLDPSNKLLQENLKKLGRAEKSSQ